MSWIKKNRFIVMLGGATLLGSALLFYFGFQAAQRYDEAKAEFDIAASEASSYENLALYPKSANRDGKRKALDEYRQAVTSLVAAFDPFRTTDLKNVTPQEFTNTLLAANTDVRKAFEESGTIVPEPFFLGFERYKTSLADGKITGLLNYQLSSIKKLMLALSQAKPTALKNLHRPNLVEEDGQAYKSAANAVARSFPLEITFVGPERSAREFLSTITKPQGQFVVIRSLRITNDKKDPPRTSDAKFDRPAAADPMMASPALPGDPLVGADVPAADSGRILAQILGNEQVCVFVRLDVLQFLPAQKIP